MVKRAFLATALALAAVSSAQAAVLISENFNDISTLSSGGWVISNLSTAGGTTSWFQGNAGIFTAQSSPDGAYIAANFLSAPAGGTIANWLISPTFSTAVAGSVTFYARADIISPYFDSISFGLASGAGSATTSFTNQVSVSPVMGTWTQYTVNFAAQGAGSVGRFAIEYLGSAANANYVGIDSFSVTTVPEPATAALLGLGLGAIALAVRRRSA